MTFFVGGRKIMLPEKALLKGI